MYKRVLVPVDGSATSRRGLRAAADLARAQRAKLTILTVVDAMPVLATFEGGMVFDQGVLDALREGARKVLDRAAAEAKKRGVRAKTVLADNTAGRVADVIVRQAKKARADLIVLGTHGRRGRIAHHQLRVAAHHHARQAAPVLLIRATGGR
jgi:nucleotide-binding universal stress UspA family protein